MIHIEITDDSNPLFLYTVDIGEEEFCQLKNEQNLLIDFQEFHMFLDQMMAPEQEKTHQYVLETDQSSMGSFRIEESSKFKQFCHIQLKMLQGNDDVLKKHLSEKIKVMSSSSDELKGENNNLQTNL